ncbi:hypothetical protein L596_010452 [Steinernema carpocapsae]|uniref:Uncharacterized protein n=1 Tax=Steinernema carpocapsae TaxID=34508 RepID=A0A4U5PIC9_STECR|nr:hypothetical protein L596_010452 [Steinernema carpocapsae]
MVLVEKIEKEKPTNVGTQTSTSAVCTFPEKRRYYLLAMANSLENEKSNLIKQMIKSYIATNHYSNQYQRFPEPWKRQQKAVDARLPDVPGETPDGLHL